MFVTKKALTLTSKNKLNVEQSSFYASTDVASSQPHTTMSFESQNEAQQTMAALPSSSMMASLLAPITPTQPDLLASSDSNISTDNITKANNLQFAGKVEANALIHLYVNGKDITAGGATKIIADANGNWSFVDSNNAVFKASQVYDVKTVTEIAGGLSKASPSLQLTVDRQISAVSTPDLLDLDDSGSSKQDNLTNAASPTVQGTSEARAFVNIYEYNPVNASYTSLFSTRADANGQWNAKLEGKAALGEGTHQLLARSSDVAGNISAFSSKINLTIDRTAPFAYAPELEASMQVPNDSHSTTYNQPVFIGKAEAGAKVELFDEDRGVVIASTVAQANSAWQVKSDVLSLGLHHLTVHVHDAAGNMTKSALSDIKVLSATPATPSMPQLESKYDSGIIGDHITNFNLPAFNLSATPGLTVRLYDASSAGDVVIGKGIANANGQVQIVTQGNYLADGNHWVYARAENASNQVSDKSAAFQLTVDTIAPQISISSPALTNSHTVQLSGTAEANLDLKVFAGNQHQYQGMARADANGKWALAINNVADGLLSYIVAEAYDVAGNFGKTPAINVVVDTVAPIVKMAVPALSNSHTVIASGTAEANLPVKVFSGNAHTFLGSTTANANGTWSVALNNIADGTYDNVRAEQSDAAGNLGISAASRFTVDTIAPRVTLSVPALTNSHTVTAYGTAEANLPVHVYSGSGHTLLGNTVANANGAWSFTMNKVADGTYYNVLAEQSDAAGNRGVSNSATVTVDTLAPTVTLNLPALTNSHSVTAYGTAEAYLPVKVFSGSAHNYVGSTVATANGTWSFTLTNVADGIYDNVRAEQIDAAGNLGISNSSTVRVDTIAPSSVTLSVPALTNSHSVTASGTAEANLQVNLYAGSAHTLLGSTVANANGAWSFTVNGVADGTYDNVRAEQSDAAGNLGISNSSTVTVDTIAPALSFTSPSYFNTHDVVLTGTAEPGLVYVYWNHDGTQTELGVVNANGGSWYLPVNNVPDGGYSLTVQESDAAGNVGRTDTYVTVRADWPIAPQDSGSVSLVGQTSLEALHGLVM